MSDERIHVWLCSPNQSFAGAVTSALGSGFETRLSSTYQIPEGEQTTAWWHVVLLDLQDGAHGEQCEASFQLIERICTMNPAAPVVVILPPDQRDLVLKVTSLGAHMILPPHDLSLLTVSASSMRASVWAYSRSSASAE